MEAMQSTWWLSRPDWKTCWHDQTRFGVLFCTHLICHLFHFCLHKVFWHLCQLSRLPSCRMPRHGIRSPTSGSPSNPASIERYCKARSVRAATKDVYSQVRAFAPASLFAQRFLLQVFRQRHDRGSTTWERRSQLRHAVASYVFVSFTDAF